MRLRQRVLLIFLGLGVLPIVAVGWFAHRRTLRAIEELVASQVQQGADRTAADANRLYRPRRSTILYFAENAETLRLLREPTSGGAGGGSSTGPDPRDHLRRAWASLGDSHLELEIMSAAGLPVFSLGGPIPGSAPEHPRDAGTAPPSVLETVEDPATGTVLGSVRASLDSAALFPPTSEMPRFGARGEIGIMERDSRKVLAGPTGNRLRDRIGNAPWPDSGSVLRFAAADSDWIAAFAPIPHSPWVVVSVASLDEFVAGVAHTDEVTLAMVVLVAALALAAGSIATRRSMRSLGTLTLAAGRVSAGDYSPDLPEPGPDEVGTLARAFRVMVQAIDGMRRRVEESRQLAAVGEFASQVAHEIRNPLTAIRVNLQALQRDLVRSPLAPDHAHPLEITLSEVDRLDRVTRGVLGLAQRPMKDPGPVHFHTEVLNAVATLKSDLDGMNVLAETSLDAPADEILADGPALRGAVMHLIRNAAEAMPGGGTVRLRSELAGSGASRHLRLHVTDEGPGIQETVRDRLFRPFVTTKQEGTGLGLAVASRTVEAHGGRLRAEDEPNGAHFVIELPLMSGSDPADPPPGGSDDYGADDPEASDPVSGGRPGPGEEGPGEVPSQTTSPGGPSGGNA